MIIKCLNLLYFCMVSVRFSYKYLIDYNRLHNGNDKRDVRLDDQKCRRQICDSNISYFGRYVMYFVFIASRTWGQTIYVKELLLLSHWLREPPFRCLQSVRDH